MLSSFSLRADCRLHCPSTLVFIECHGSVLTYRRVAERRAGNLLPENHIYCTSFQFILPILSPLHNTHHHILRHNPNFLAFLTLDFTNPLNSPHPQTPPSHHPLQRLHHPIIPKIHIVQIHMPSERRQVPHPQNRFRLAETHAEAEVLRLGVLGEPPGGERGGDQDFGLGGVWG